MSLGRPPPGCRRPGAEGVLDEIRVALLECKVCFESFSVQRTERRPRSLLCGHVLCAACVAALSNPVLRSLECPFCRKACSVCHTSDCLPLAELSELLHRSSRLPPNLPVSRDASRPGGLAAGALRLHSAFGGWGKLLNPTGVAISEAAGAIVVVHDGQQRVVLFRARGEELQKFGQKSGSRKQAEEILHPLDVAVGPDGHVVVTDGGDGAVKVFTPEGRLVVAVRDSFRLPWGVTVDGGGRMLVTDAEADTLSQLAVDFARSRTLLNRVACADLQCPRSVACCPATGKVMVVEHMGDLAEGRRSRRPVRFSLFSGELVLLSRIDSFGLSLPSPLRLRISAVAFDMHGNVIVADVEQASIWSLGTSHGSPSLIPLVSQGLLCPQGLAVTSQNMLVVLDSGDHAVKIFSASSDPNSPRQ
ncbi:E3 ubiquitin-protein ligase NHLRC1-like isoform X2 [Brienomyrus brachyistius]|uniref:E3 ubiquitin-protein ligase NHLRC1-like isoform X2 n=1 Tax=Brienomyrus brachyistius TaxID=42636 RepID=UPI0020B2D2AB|nr:E3 ubiquitin-protein ligase NHLRC1-like isoform X2 [Brienomyrus brachyistius]